MIEVELSRIANTKKKEVASNSIRLTELLDIILAPVFPGTLIFMSNSWLGSLLTGFF